MNASGQGAGPGPGAVRRQRLILFTRYPNAGRTKTRLIPALGAEGAAALQRRLTLRTLRTAEAASQAHGWHLEIQFSDADATALRHWLGDRFSFCPQVSGDLGQRMLAAFAKSAGEGFQATVLIGADCPDLTADILAEAFRRLDRVPVTFGPARDGGYYLVGLREPLVALFTGLGWGTNTVLADSLRISAEAGLKASLLPVLGDLDRPEDLDRWRQIEQAEAREPRRVSVIIPALNEASQILAAIRSARAAGPWEVLVVDGGSQDGTQQRAREAGAKVLISGKGRARQMNAGASKAEGNIFLFLHADTLLPANYIAEVIKALGESSVAAGAFQFALAGAFAGRRLIERTTNLRARWAQTPYGDQALFLGRALFDQLGGFAALPILEDYELVRRLRRLGRIVILGLPALTSGRRWQELGPLRTTLLNQWMILGYRLGWPVERLAATYRSHTRRKPCPDCGRSARRRFEGHLEK